MRMIEAMIREQDGGAQIEFQFKVIDQLIDTNDPSPLSEKELTQVAEDAIYTYTDKVGHRKPVSLVVRVPQPAEFPDFAASIPHAIRSHFTKRLNDLWIDRSISLREGKVSLSLTLLTAFATFWILWFYLEYSSSFFYLLLTGLVIIINWVMVWDTYEYFVYDWRIAWRKRRIYAKISQADVEIREAR
jgi:hypothetical protein